MHKKNKSLNLKPIPSSTYSKDYYLSDCDGYSEFDLSRGKILPPRLQRVFDMAEVTDGERILDLGCGRGEFTISCAQLGATVCGIDYSVEALKLARDLVTPSSERDLSNQISLLRSDSKNLPLSNDQFHKVFMLDIVEHLYPEELQETLIDIWRILLPGGKLFIHTMPNLWYYRFGYPIYRLLQRFRGNKLPLDPRDRWRYSHVHVNEQTIIKLSRMLKSCKYNAKVWISSVHDYHEERNPLIRTLMLLVTRLYPFRWIFCDDIFAIAIKPPK